MKEYEVEQGSDEWKALRMGRVTASEMKRIVTNTGKLSSAAHKYMGRLIAEQLFGELFGEDIEMLEHVANGKAREPEAADLYSLEQGVDLRRIGFITTDDGRWGASLDRLIVGQPGAVEIKCPAPQTHITYAIAGFGDDYMCQAQAQILIGEGTLEYVDRYSYYPKAPPVRVRTHPDATFQRTLKDALTKFSDEMDGHLLRLRREGYYESSPSIKKAVDRELGDAA
jgi:hypothetical protein